MFVGTAAKTSPPEGEQNMKAAWIFVIIGSSLGALILLLTFFGGESAPQEAAGAGLAIAMAAIPYCFARALSEIGGRRS